MTERTSEQEVARLMKGLRERAAAKRAAGLYSVDALKEDPARVTQPVFAEELAELYALGEIDVNLEAARSTKKHIGSIVGKVKGLLVRATSQPLEELSSKSTTFNMALVVYVGSLAEELAVLRAELELLRRESGAPLASDEHE